MTFKTVACPTLEHLLLAWSFLFPSGIMRFLYISGFLPSEHSLLLCHSLTPSCPLDKGISLAFTSCFSPLPFPLHPLLPLPFFLAILSYQEGFLPWISTVPPLLRRPGLIFQMEVLLGKWFSMIQIAFRALKLLMLRTYPEPIKSETFGMGSRYRILNWIFYLYPNYFSPNFSTSINGITIFPVWWLKILRIIFDFFFSFACYMPVNSQNLFCNFNNVSQVCLSFLIVQL